jgi:hypothetical protein
LPLIGQAGSGNVGINVVALTTFFGCTIFGAANGFFGGIGYRTIGLNRGTGAGIIFRTRTESCQAGYNYRCKKHFFHNGLILGANIEINL